MNKVKSFFINVKAEMTKVSWPARDELINSTVVVIVSVAILTIFIYLIDLLYTLVIGAIIK
jgi:preprotein translocase subunit SecE